MNILMRKGKLILAIALVLGSLNVNAGVPAKVKPTKNLVLMITDGTSTSLLATARWYHRYVTDSLDWALNLDPYICGLVQSRLSDAIIPDSAPAMSGYVTGVPSRAGNLSIYPEPHPGQDVLPTEPEMAFHPAETILEASKAELGKSSGIVVTCHLDHATPAACASHTAGRGRAFDIAWQMVSNDVDILFGGGNRYVNEEMAAELEKAGIKLHRDDYGSFKSIKAGKNWALFGDSDTQYEIERNRDEQPSLSEMAVKALEVLSKDKDGFFLMIEGSKVDYGAHSKDVAAAVTEFIEFDKTFGKVLEFAKKNGNTTIVVLPDHGNSGITLGDANYRSYSSKGPDSMFVYMKDYKNTSSTLAGMVGKCKTPEEIKAVFKERMNIDLKPYELEGVIAAINRTESDYMKISGSRNLQSVIASIMQSRTHIGFTSGNHTGEDVFLAVYNPNGQRPSGIITNTQLNQYMCRILGLKTSLRALSERDFSKAGDVFPGCTLSVNKDGSYPVLTVSGGGHTLVIPAWHSKYTLDGREISTPHPAVYMPDNDTFYVSTTLGKLMK